MGLNEKNVELTDENIKMSDTEDESFSESDSDDSMNESSDSSESLQDTIQTERSENDEVINEENDEEDEVIKAIIKENQKPREKPPIIKLEDDIIDICFHPKEDILAVATIEGDVLLYKYKNEENILLHTVELHTKSCRDVEFSRDGKRMFTTSKDKSIMLTNVETTKLEKFYENAHEYPIYCLTVVDKNIFATGDDDGVIRLWDCRQPNFVLSTKKNEDYISDMISVDNDKYLCCASGDGSLTTLDLCNRKFLMQSIEYEEELTCLGTVRRESKIVATSNKGKIFLFNMKEFGMHSDEFPSTKSSINNFVPITENIIVTGCEDGNLRAVHLFPHRHIGVVGQHESSIENIDICNDGRLLASSTTDNDIKFWNIKFFEDFEKVSHKHNKHNKKKEMEHNLPSSSKKNVSDFFGDLV